MKTNTSTLVFSPLGFSLNHAKRYVQSGATRSDNLFVKILVLSILFTAIFLNVTAGNGNANPTATLSKLYTNMYVVNSDGSATLSDGTVSTYYPTYHNAVDAQDAPKFNSFNTRAALCIVRDGIELAIEKRQPIVDRDTTYLEMIQMENRQYQFEFVAQNFDANIVSYLKDDFTGTMIPINLSMSDTTRYTFTVYPDNSSSRTGNRFSIVYAPLGNLPVNFTGFNVSAQSKAVNIDWNVENEINIDQYNIERSANGSNFSVIGAMQPSQNIGGANKYNWSDNYPANGVNYYRIQFVNKNGSSAYSKIMKIVLGQTTAAVKIYPTVVTDNTFDLQFVNMQKGAYQLQVTNTNGQVVFTRSLNHSGGSATQNIAIDTHTGSGMYQVQVMGPDNFKNTTRFMKK